MPGLGDSRKYYGNSKRNVFKKVAGAYGLKASKNSTGSKLRSGIKKRVGRRKHLGYEF